MLEAEKLKEILFNNKKSGWEKIEEDKKKEIYKFSDEYIHYLNKCKTERETIEFSKEVLDKNGFTDIKNKEKLSSGDKVYYINRDKSMYIAVIGEKPLEGGMQIVGAHVDSPRLDLKPNPLYEEQGFRIFKNSLLWRNKKISMDYNSFINSWCYCKNEWRKN